MAVVAIVRHTKEFAVAWLEWFQGFVGKWWLDIDTPWGSHQMCFLVCDTQLLVPDSIAVNLAMVPVLYTVFIIMTVSITIGMNEESIVDDDGGG